MKINLTKLLETNNCVYWGEKYPTDASDYVNKQDRASQEEVYAFELEPHDTLNSWTESPDSTTLKNGSNHSLG